ncbi:M23 family metallopeptidase [Actinomadura sp. 6N118]|uniref:M23 family metallopeptidase n=1 Tax=Actinomadura sp. 6N118 TaxID=3375151 RepID=UPI00379085D8
MRTFALHVSRFKTLIIFIGAVLALSTYLHGNRWVLLAALFMIVAGFALMLVHPARLAPQCFAGRPLNAPAADDAHADGAPRSIQAPVRGSWVPVHSPADKVPSHGVDAYGQTYAIDLVHHTDEEDDWSGVHAWPPARRAGTFSGFGQPIFAPADGEVVRVAGWHRDHWSRNSWIALPFMMVEAMVRELGGPGFIIGNHVILDLGDGTYAAFAHLKRGSIKVKPGQRVRVGEHIADCGNSGNTSEPHLHFQLMDRPRPMIANGVPFAFERYEVDGEEQRGVPGGHRPFTVPTTDHAPAP